MDEMMEESREQSGGSGEEEETEPGLLTEIVQVGVDAESGGDGEIAPADWLEPLDEECGEAGKEGVQNGSSEQQGGRRKRGGWRKRKGGRRKVLLTDDWIDCSELGKGWKKKIIHLRSTSDIPKQTMNYMSPNGFRIRSKINLKKRVKVDVTNFDFHKGIFVDDLVKPKRQRSRSLHSSFSFSTDALQTQDSITETPQKPRLTRKSLAASAAAPLPLNELSSSPLKLSHVSPTTQQAPQPSLSPSLRLGDFSTQIENDFITPEKNKTALLSRSWLQSPLAPVSPAETPSEKDPPTFLSALKSSPDIHRPSDASAAINGEKQENGFSYKICVSCGSQYLNSDCKDDGLCILCSVKPRQRPPPHIIFKKVGQDKWIVGKRKSEGFMKKKITKLGKKSKSRSVQLLARKEKKKENPEIKTLDSEEDDYVLDDGVDDDDDPEFGPKKRKRRMCGQCNACLRNQDCGKCDFCKDKPKFGGHNKKRQKCRLRQCKFRSRLKTWKIRQDQSTGLVDEAEDDQEDELEDEKHSRSQRKRDHQWKDVFTDSEAEDNEDEEHHPGKKGREGRRRKGKYSYKLEEEDEEDDRTGGADVKKDGLNSLEETQFVVGDDGDIVFYEEINANRHTPGAQNGSMEIVESSDGQPALVMSSQPSQDWVCTVAGLPEGSQVLGSVNLSSNGPVQLSDVCPSSSAPISNILTSNPHLSEIINTNWINLNWAETAMPQVIQQPEPTPEPAKTPPLVLQTHSLLDDDPVEDPGLLELLTSLRRTVLPAHWVGVMAKGPLLQVFQCSKLSPMADTVLQIEKDFYFQINVQNQPLLLTHPVYERHPPRLPSASLVVALLLDLEEMNVCQGYQSFEEGPNQTPLLCARAALCQLIIPQDEECCERCLLPINI
ncbi:methyl-CpG-binding domain protein 1a [Astyanax mexicanus]|uniref:methyl-CpG-binding domain protein 1a n=1 Tax=Astyanax mexicanus TaxID=7994 RepID=UPI0020CAFF4E|nr:methyl-CpG-binding domain protein 1a [Astyanax mexicanus]